MNGTSNELEDQIPMLRKLDKLRVESAKLREEGLEALEGWLGEEEKENKGKTNEEMLIEEKKTADIAIIVRAFCERPKDSPVKLILISKEPQPAPSYRHGCRYPAPWMVTFRYRCGII